MSWSDMARDNLVAAKSLLADARWRSAVSRAYYAAYSAVTGKLKGRASFPRGRQNPSHDNLARLIMNYLTEFAVSERRQMMAAARRLYRTRIAADYKPGEEVGVQEARIAVRDASFIVRTVERAED
jgi:uncharacterized protein (UPF0332 family)